jgi:hypothetical protein
MWQSDALRLWQQSDALLFGSTLTMPSRAFLASYSTLQVPLDELLDDLELLGLDDDEAAAAAAAAGHHEGGSDMMED